MGKMFDGEMKCTVTFAKHVRTNIGWLYDVEPYSRIQTKSFDDIGNDLRLKKHLKRAVETMYAPQSLLDSIKSGIRK